MHCLPKRQEIALFFIEFFRWVSFYLSLHRELSHLSNLKWKKDQLLIYNFVQPHMNFNFKLLLALKVCWFLIPMRKAKPLIWSVMDTQEEDVFVPSTKISLPRLAQRQPTHSNTESFKEGPPNWWPFCGQEDAFHCAMRTIVKFVPYDSEEGIIKQFHHL